MITTQQNDEHLIKECMRIENDSLYTAEAHYILASKEKRLSIWVKVVPAAVAAVSGILVLRGYPAWVAWFAVISGVVFALQSVLDPDRKANDHSTAGKEYTALKHEARSLYQTFSKEMDKSDFTTAVRLLRERYDSLVKHSPQTTEKAFEEGRKRIKSGRHTPDFEE
jgi:hypothetical protein